MVWRILEFQNSRVFALDGEVGRVRDVYFDEATWRVQYLVIDTGGWLPGRKVLISPRSVELIDEVLHTVSLSVTQARLQASPGVPVDKLVARRDQMGLSRVCSYPSYWARQWTNALRPRVSFPEASDALEPAPSDLERQPHGDSHLSSARAISAYSCNALDGGTARVADLLLDATWSIRFLLLATNKRRSPRRWLIDKTAVTQVDRGNRCLEVDWTRRQIDRPSLFDRHQRNPRHP